jgi:hypothetical protein
MSNVEQITATGDRESNMWQHHIDQLLRIIRLRRQALTTEPYEFLVQMVFNIDVYALLSTSSTGAFAEFVRETMLPSPESCFPPSDSGGATALTPDEQNFLPASAKLHQEIHLVALQVGILARDLRRGTGPSDINSSVQGLLQNTAVTQERIRNLHQRMAQSRASWSSQFPDYLTWLSGSQHLPPRIFDLIMHVSEINRYPYCSETDDK